MSYNPINKRVFTPQIIETNQSADLRAHSELAGVSDGSRWIESGLDALPAAIFQHSSVVFNGKMWVIGGFIAARSRAVYYSTDGITWTLASATALPVATYLHTSLVYDGKMWCIGGDNNNDGVTQDVHYSRDGTTWSTASSTALPVATYSHGSVVFNGRMWVIGGVAGARTRKVYYSTDGIRWTEAGVDALPVATSSISGSVVVFNGRMWVIGGNDGASVRKVYYSTDGATWTEAGVDALPVATRESNAVVYNGKMWLLGGFGVARTREVYSSSDGIVWTLANTVALPLDVYRHSALVYGGRMWTIGGNDTSGATRKVHSTVPQQSGIVIDGARYIKRTPTAVSYAALRSDHYIGVTSTAAVRTITLPAVADAVVGKEYIIADESGVCSVNNITIQAAGAELIDGSNTYVMNSNYQSTTVVCTGTGWGVV